MRDPMRLQLMIGRIIPQEVPNWLVEALLDLEVTNQDSDRDGFQMTFTLGKELKNSSDYRLLLNGLLDPPNRVIIIVFIGSQRSILIDGMITNHQVVPSNKPGESRLIVTGEDISLKLDLEERSDTYPRLPDFAIVNLLLAKYAIYGLVPLVTPSFIIPDQNERIPTQVGTDLSYIKELAERNSFVFYTQTTTTLRVNKAYWGPEIRTGQRQPALSMNMGPDTNAESITFSLNALEPVEPQVSIIAPFIDIRVNIPVPTNLLRPRLSKYPANPLRKTVPRDVDNLDNALAMLKAAVLSNQSSDAVTATGSVDTVRYGHVLQARKLVGVRGVGNSYDGDYYVKQVTHNIKLGEYKQSFTLTREGRGARNPEVML